MDSTRTLRSTCPSPVWVRARCRGARRLQGDPHRYVAAKARKNYADTSPITKASGKRKVALARFIHNDRLIDGHPVDHFTAGA